MNKVISSTSITTTRSGLHEDGVEAGVLADDVIPRYEPVFVEANLKEYETQVLQMSVPLDELQDHEMQMDQRDLRHQLHHQGQVSGDSQGSSDHTHTTNATYRADQAHHYSTVEDPSGTRSSGGEWSSTLNHTLTNMSMSRSDSEEGLRGLSASQTNANVLFGANASGGNKFTSSTPRRRKADSSSSDRGGGQLDDSSPIDSTTQL